MQGRQAGRLGADRPALRRPEVFLEPPLGHLARMPYNAASFRRLQPGPAEPGADAMRSRVASTRCARPIRATGAGPGRPGDRLGQRPGPAHQPGGGAVPGGARRPRAHSIQTWCRGSSRATPRAGCSASSAKPASTCWSSISRWTRPPGTEPISTVNDGLGILLALMVVVVPLLLAWFLCTRYPEPRETSHSPKRKK